MYILTRYTLPWSSVVVLPLHKPIEQRLAPCDCLHTCLDMSYNNICVDNSTSGCYYCTRKINRNMQSKAHQFHEHGPNLQQIINICPQSPDAFDLDAISNVYVLPELKKAVIYLWAMHSHYYL